MDITNILLGISNIFVAFLVIVISIPLTMGKIPMNKIYGIRFTKSYESEAIWYKINAYGGKQLIIWSIPLMLLGIVTFFLPIEDNDGLATLIAIAPLILLVPAFVSYKYAQKL